MRRRFLFALCITLSVTTVGSAADILFLGRVADPSHGDDDLVFEHLEESGHNVTYMSATDAISGDEEDFDLLILSSTPDSGNMRGKFQYSETPILNWEEAIMDSSTDAGNFSMGAAGDNGGNFRTMDLEIIDPAHPLAAGLSGIVTYADPDVAPAHITGPAPGVLSIAKLPEGNVSNPTYVEGNAAPVGNDKSIRMGGSGTIDVATIDRPGGPFAYSFWFNPDSDRYGDTFDTGDPRVDFFYGDGNGGSVRPHLSANRNGRPIGIYVADDLGDVAEPIEAVTDSFATDEWHHVAISFDGEVGSVFVNGVLDNTVDLAGEFGAGELEPSGTGMHIGTTQNSSNPFVGLLDEVAIWDRELSFEVNGDGELTGGELSTIFSSGVHAVEGDNGPTGYWPMDDQSDPLTVFDASGNDHDGLLPDVDNSNARIVISAVEPGGELDDGTEATGRRVNFPIVDTGFGNLTEDGIKLFDAAISWLLGEAPNPVAGDFNGNGMRDVGDLDLLADAQTNGGDVAKFDLTGDGNIDKEDRTFWVVDLSNTHIGDSNFDGEFSSSDFVKAFQGGKYENGEEATWEQGDWDGNQRFTSGDFVFAFQAGGYEGGPRDGGLQVVPEPSACVLMILGTAILILRRRR